MDIVSRLSLEERAQRAHPLGSEVAADVFRDARVEIERLRKENEEMKAALVQATVQLIDLKWKLDRIEGRIVTTANHAGPDETFGL